MATGDGLRAALQMPPSKERWTNAAQQRGRKGVGAQRQKHRR